MKRRRSQPRTAPAARPVDPRWLAPALLALTLGVTAAIRLRLLDFPLERDEGEYAYFGQLILQGIPPYVEAYNMKWPGTYAAYAAIMAIFGQTADGIHLGLTLVTLATAGFVFLLARRICGEIGAAAAAGAYALLAVSPSTLGFAAHATHFVMLPALGGILLLRDLDSGTRGRRIFAAGLLLGLASLMKQSGAAFGLFAALWITWIELSATPRNLSRFLRRALLLALGGLAPLAITVALLAAAGALPAFWHWTIDYARAYVGIISPAGAWTNFTSTSHRLFVAAPGLWLLAALGVAALWTRRDFRPWKGFVSAWLAFSFIAVCPGWYFREHYFLLLVPAAAVLVGIAVASATALIRPPWLRIAAPLGCFLVAAGHSLWASRDVLFLADPMRAARLVYGLNPFPESVRIGEQLAKHCPPDSRIAVIGSEPQIYFYSRRRAATGYLYTYPLVEPQPYAARMQEEMIAEIERARPRYVVFVSVASSWLRRPDSPSRIFEWFTAFQNRLRLVGFVEFQSDTEVTYRWNPSGLVVSPRSDTWLAIFEDPTGK